jgi:DNA-binding NarL/FixJ family response regulator
VLDEFPLVRARLVRTLASRVRSSDASWVRLAGDAAPVPDVDAEAAAELLGRLTTAELRVAELVAEGLSNARIAERLVVSRHTVDSHVKHTLAKLGVRSRVQLAAIVLRRRPAP